MANVLLFYKMSRQYAFVHSCIYTMVMIMYDVYNACAWSSNDEGTLKVRELIFFLTPRTLAL